MILIAALPAVRRWNLRICLENVRRRRFFACTAGGRGRGGRGGDEVLRRRGVDVTVHVDRLEFLGQGWKIKYFCL